MLPELYPCQGANNGFFVFRNIIIREQKGFLNVAFLHRRRHQVGLCNFEAFTYLELDQVLQFPGFQQHKKDRTDTKKEGKRINPLSGRNVPILAVTASATPEPSKATAVEASERTSAMKSPERHSGVPPITMIRVVAITIITTVVV